MGQRTKVAARAVSLTLAAALFMAITVLWAGGAEAKPKAGTGKPFAEVQLLAFNDFHGYLEPVETGLADCPTAGGAAYLGAYLNQPS